MPVYAAGTCILAKATYSHNRCLHANTNTHPHTNADRQHQRLPSHSVCMATGLYLHVKKMDELETSKSLSTLNIPYESSSRKPLLYLALKLTFAKYESTKSIVEEFAKELAGSKIEYKRALDHFNEILTRQISTNATTGSGAGASGMQKGEEMEFLFQGTKILGEFIAHGCDYFF